MPLPRIYHEDYSAGFPADHRFPMDKFRLLRDHLADSGYIERYMSGELSREDQRRLGLRRNEVLAWRTVRTEVEFCRRMTGDSR